MNDKYEKRFEDFEGYFYEYENILRAMRDDVEFNDEEFAKTVLDASISKIFSNDQKKGIKAVAKEVVSDKAYLKEFNAKVKDA